MIKILMLVPVWKRPEILRLFIYRMEANIPDYATVMPLFILSPEDPYLKVIEKFTADYNTFYYSNEYLSDKVNAGMTYSMTFEWDYLLGMGSDNIYTMRLWDLYEDYFMTGEKYFAMDNFYVYDMINNRGAYMSKYVDDKDLGGIGAGRVTHRSLLEDDPAIYKPHVNCGCDGFSAVNLARKGHIQKIVETDELPVLLDIKTRTNINQPEEIWHERKRDVPVEWLKEQFGLTDARILDDGTFDLLNFDNFHNQICRLSQEIRKEDAFNTINTRYEVAYGVPRFKNVESYKSYVSQLNKK